MSALGTIDSAVRAVIGEELRRVVREELPGLLAQLLPAMPGGDCYLAVAKAAEIADVHPDTIRGWVKAGHLAQHRAGRELRIRLDELRRFLDGGGGGPKNRQTPEEEANQILSRRGMG
jgi:excisionase family DNA binding protein